MQTYTRMNVAIIAQCLLCAVVLLSSCASGHTGGAHNTASPPHTPTPFTVNLTPLSMQQAWGQIHISQFSLDMGDRYFAPNAQDNGITDDGQACGHTYPMYAPRTADLSHYIDSIGLIDLHTGHVTLLATLPPGYSVTACTVTGPWVIWLQTYGTNGVAGGNLKALNRQTGEIRQLDQGRASDHSTPSSPDASKGRVVWTTYSQGTPEEAQSVIYTFATGTKTVLALHTSDPQISWPWISWRDGVGKAMVFENLETKQQVRLPMPTSPLALAFAGTSFVYTNDDLSQVTLVPSILAQPMGSYVIQDKANDGSDFDEFPTLNERLVSWVGPHSWLVFDRKLLRPVKIPIGVRGFDGFISSHYIVATPTLTQADFDAQRQGLPFHHVMQVIDTNTLP